MSSTMTKRSMKTQLNKISPNSLMGRKVKKRSRED